MANREIYDQRLKADSASLNTNTGPQAGADAFGAGIGRSMQDLARGISTVGNVAEQMYEKQVALWHANTMAEVDAHWTKRMGELKVEADGQGYDGYVSKVEQEFNQYRSEIKAKAPTPGAAKNLEVSLSGYFNDNVLKQAVGQEARYRVMSGVDNFTGAVTGAIDAGIRTGDLEATRAQVEAIMGTAQGVIPKEVLDHQGEKAFRRIDEAGIQQAVGQFGPEEAASMLEKGDIGKTLKPEEQIARVEQLRRSAALQNAATAEEANRLWDNANAAIMSGSPDAEDLITAAKGAYVSSHTRGTGPSRIAGAQRAAANFDAKVTTARTVGSIRQGMIGKTPEWMDGKVAELEAAFGRESDLAKEARKQAGQFTTLLKNDPATYAQIDPDVNAATAEASRAWEAFKQQTTPENQKAAQAAQAKATDLSLALQRMAGVPSDRLSIIGKKEADFYRSNMKTADGAQKTFKSVAARYGEEHAPTVMRQLFADESGQVDPIYRLAALAPENPQIWDAAKGDFKVKTDGGENSDANQLSRAIQDNPMWQQYDKALPAGAASIQERQQMAQGLQKMAAYYLYGGGGNPVKPKEAVDRAVKATLGNAYDFIPAGNGKTMAVPKGLAAVATPPSVKEGAAGGWSSAMNIPKIDLGTRLQTFALKVTDPSNPYHVIVPDGYTPESFMRNVRDNGYWQSEGETAVRVIQDGTGRLRAVMVPDAQGQPQPLRISLKSAALNDFPAPPPFAPTPKAQLANPPNPDDAWKSQLMDWVDRNHLPYQTDTTATQDAKNMSSMSDQIVQWEGRYKDGKLQVYKLPSNDGGGRYEVAGINEKYDPEMAKHLAELIREGKHDQAQKEASAYIDKQTAPVAAWTSNKGVEAYLRDTAFNRGMTGAAKIMQMALGVTVDGKVGPKTRAALKQAEMDDPKALLLKLRAAREEYERKVVGVRTNLWKGLVNRWDKALSVAQSLV